MKRNATQGYDLIILIQSLHQLCYVSPISEFYRNRTDTTQGFASLCKPSLTVKRSSANITKRDVL